MSWKGTYEGGRKRGKLNYGKKIDPQKQWEFEKRDLEHERMVREFFAKRAKDRKKNRKSKR